MKIEDLIKFLKNEIEPIEDDIYGLEYRTSAHLKDGTFLPGVTFRNSDKITEQRIKRMEDVKSGNGKIRYQDNRDPFKEIMKLFVAKGNRVNDYDIDKVQRSEFAFSKKNFVKNTRRIKNGLDWIYSKNEG